MERIKDIVTPEPGWQGLTDLEMTRLKSAADQLLCQWALKTSQTGRNEKQPF
jgi:hypothetical protein